MVIQRFGVVNEALECGGNVRLLLDLRLQIQDFVPGVRVEDQVVAAACPHKELQTAMLPRRRIRSRVLVLYMFSGIVRRRSGGLFAGEGGGYIWGGIITLWL